jgi:hypothetical protein
MDRLIFVLTLNQTRDCDVLVPILESTNGLTERLTFSLPTRPARISPN